jgi:hypothetical protein
MTILCEKTYAEERLKNGFTRQGSFLDLLILAKYFRYIGKDSEQIKNALIEFCEKFSSDYNKTIFEKRILDAVSKSKKYALRIYQPIGITKDELESIRSVAEYKKQKILFTMLFFSKVFKNDTDKNIFYCNVSYTEILKTARVKMLAREKMEVTRELNVLGLIRTNSNGKYEILFADKEQNNFEILVKDKENVISYLLFRCPNCGKEIEMRSKSRKMCDECLLRHKNELNKSYYHAKANNLGKR